MSQLKSYSLFPAEFNFAFINHRNIAFAISALAIVISVGAFLTRGLNYGIDFRGGSLIELVTPEAADLSVIRSSVDSLGLGDIRVQEFGAPNDVLVIVERVPGTGPEAERAQQDAARAVTEAIQAAVPGATVARTEVVGGAVSGELVQAGTLAVVVSLALMLLYIWLRFEWQFSLGAVIALVHDVIITIGMFAITQIEFNLSIIAAILTIVGYSMNDTVVVYDRVREKMRKFKKMALADLLNLAINKTLSRTLMTSLTTIVALLSLYILGGQVLRGFSFAMIWGVLVGTYSSIFIAAPFLLLTGARSTESDEDGAAVADRA